MGDKGTLRPLALAVGLVCILLTAGCADVLTKSPRSTATESGATSESPAQAEVAPSVEGKAARATAESTPPVKGQSSAATEAAPGGSVAKLESPPAKPAMPSAAKPTPAPGAAEQAKPPLDLDSLENRLKETGAIGFFTKLALKNQVDELLDNFRAFYQGHSGTTLERLRQSFELLFMKVLALLQDRDPTLAHDILVSREAIWDVLADPEKFAKI